MLRTSQLYCYERRRYDATNVAVMMLRASYLESNACLSCNDASVAVIILRTSQFIMLRRPQETTNVHSESFECSAFLRQHVFFNYPGTPEFPCILKASNSCNPKVHLGFWYECGYDFDLDLTMDPKMDVNIDLHMNLNVELNTNWNAALMWLHKWS